MNTGFEFRLGGAVIFNTCIFSGDRATDHSIRTIKESVNLSRVLPFRSFED